jgi:L-histidine Nalpha-methyltransferase
MSALAFYDLHRANPQAIAAELGAGLLAPRAHTSPKYLYDKLGSCLFDAITELPEYYPTRTEAAIFAHYQHAMAAALPAGATLVDLGAASCAKAASLFGALKPSRYVAVDISAEYLRGVLTALSAQHPALPMAGVGMDFSSNLHLPAPLLASMQGAPVVGFYPGSSIGNYTPQEALAFLQRVCALCRSTQSATGGVLIGIDLVKPKAILEPAYDDALGVTAAFNLNMLRHINQLIGADFDVRDWQHVAFFDEAQSRIEMHLEAKRALTVRWGDAANAQVRQFAAGERIHTENSYKWTPEGFKALLLSAGFAHTHMWTDADGYFAVFSANL